MRFEYHGDTAKALKHILGDKREFEDQVTQASRGDDVTDVAVHPLTPGLSGAAVFLVRRVGTLGALTPWVVKASRDPGLIIEERENNERFVQSRVPAAPALIPNGSSRLLLFRFGAHLADYHPQTLRSGYARSSPEALATLMGRVVTSLKALHESSDDVASCVDRMAMVPELEQRLDSMKSPLPPETASRLRERWMETLANRDTFPRIRSTAHGDLNAGNVLFEPGDAASHPVFIDFASMRRSKDSKGYAEFYHLPFWDYAKLERDIQTRLFLKEAIAAELDTETVVGAIRAIDGVVGGPIDAASRPVIKLSKTTLALREAIRNEHSPANFDGCYRVVLAYAMLTVLFRDPPDADVSQDLQHLVAAEASIALLADPFVPLPSGSVPPPSSDSTSRLTADERQLVAHIYRYKGLCRIGAARGEYESLWCPGDLMDMQWGWERTPEEARESGKAIGDRTERLRWLFVVRDLVTKGLLKELPKRPGERNTLYELTDQGWRAGSAMAGGARD